MNISKSFIKDVVQATEKYGFSAGGGGVEIIDITNETVIFMGKEFVCQTEFEESTNIYILYNSELFNLLDVSVLNKYIFKMVDGNTVNYSCVLYGEEYNGTSHNKDFIISGMNPGNNMKVRFRKNK